MELSTGMSCATADDGGDPICTPSLHKLQESAAKDPATATPSNSLRSIAGFSTIQHLISLSRLPLCTFQMPLSVPADCYAMQIAIRGGIQQAISDAVEAFEERTSKLAAAHLAEEKVRDGQVEGACSYGDAQVGGRKDLDRRCCEQASSMCLLVEIGSSTGALS